LSGKTARTTPFSSWLGLDTGDNYEGPTTPDLEWPTWIVYSAIPLGTSLMCFRFLQVTMGFLKTGELPHHDHGHVDGLEEEVPPVDFDPYGMDDNLHMHDLKHTMTGDRRTGDERRNPVEDSRIGSERRAAQRRDDGKKGDQS
jgi:C4-dicarboxylate transporter DctQ subunit